MKNALFRKPAVFMLTLLLSLTTYGKPVIHRAVEPAQIMLDITLKESILTLYLTIPASAYPLLVENRKQEKTVSLLAKASDLWLPDPDAECALSSQRIFYNGFNVVEDSKAAKNSKAAKDSKEAQGNIQGFYDFNCLNPMSLYAIRPNILSALPGLKQLNIWLTTDNWQNKQSLIMPGEGKIIIKPDF